jgi:chitin disaccharide deacetylase
VSPDAPRFLLVTADDFGIGPETTRGILDLAARGAVTSTVLLVNSPFAEAGVTAWRAAGRPVELGWHPCLTIDAPVLPPSAVPSLVGADGRFPRLGTLLKRLALGRVRAGEAEAEFRAQLARFVELVGAPPANVNAHHHVHVFRPVGDALARALAGPDRPFTRRAVEPVRTLRRVPGARLKRALLTWYGKRAARRQAAAGLPGNDALLGFTDPPFTDDPAFFARWLSAATGRFVDLMCHPGHFDPALAGRDGTLTDGSLHRRPREFALLARPGFLDAVRAAGFTLVTATQLVAHLRGEGGAALRPAA